MTNNRKLAPTPEIISQLRNTAHIRDYRAYRRLIEQVDWQLFYIVLKYIT